ncbi:ABC transporter ATP-binding protein [Agathobacter sp.]
MIEVKNLSLEKNNKKILDSISFRVNDGSIMGLIGPNGSGKTLVMKCICGLIVTYDGQIIINGIEARKIEKKSIGMIIENPGFITSYSGFKNLKILAQIKKKVDKAGIKENMKAVGLDPSNRLPVGKYSLGMRQRLGIAQALMEDEKILILDEPFNSLDEEMTNRLRNRILLERDKGKCIIISSHNRVDIDMLCDNVIEIKFGRGEMVF